MEREDGPPTEQLRQVLIAAMDVARAGQKDKPPIDPPMRLRQLLNFKKVSDRALGQVREVVENDEEFRERVVEGIEDEEAVGRLGWLWLVRPEGWEQECRELAEAADSETEQSADDQRTEALEQRLQKVRADLDRAERRREKAVEERDLARTEANQHRTEARHAVEKAESLEAELERVRADESAERKKSVRVQRKRDRIEAKLKSANKQINRLKKELGEAREQHRVDIDGLKEQLDAARDEVAQARAAGFEPEPEPVVEPEPEPAPPLTHRIPAPLPPGMLRDTVEAAEHLLRHVSDLVVLVDGYNVTFKSWQGMSVRDQRLRFLQKLEELSARYAGVDFVVVFDGIQTDYDYIPTTARSLGVSVRFSDPGVTADDHIIGLCDTYPLHRSIVVVSEDNEVRERARDRGANLVRPYKLLEIMGLEIADPLGWPGFGDR